MKLTPAWVEAVQSAADAKGWTQERLARECGRSKGTVNKMLKQAWGSSETVSRVAEVLGLEDPSAQLLDEEIQRWTYYGILVRQHDRPRFDKLLNQLESTLEEDEQLERAFGLKGRLFGK